MGIRPVLSRKDPKVHLYAWALETSTGQAPLTIKVDLVWIFSIEDRITVNKVATVETMLQNTELFDPRVTLGEGAPTEKVRAEVAVYIPFYLTSALLTGVRLPHEVWSILCDRANRLQISKDCLFLWACLRVRLLTDYVGDLDSRLAHMLAPPQRKALTKKRVLLIKQMLPAPAPALTSAVPDPFTSI